MELFIAVASAVVASIFAWRAYEYSKTRRDIGKLTSGTKALGEGAQVDGHPQFGGWHFFDVRTDGDQRYERWAYRCTVQGVLPDWVMMDYSARRPAGSRAFLPEALFGRERVEALPDAWRVFAERGDVVLQSEERYLLRVPRGARPEIDAAAAELARAYLARGEGPLRAALVEAVDVQGEAEALRLLCRQFPDAPEVAAAAQEGLHHEMASVRVVSARHLGAEGHPALRRISADAELPISVRREACQALAARGDHEALLQVAVGASSGVEDIVADALAGANDPRVEAAVLPFLEHDSEVVVEAAAGALAQRGTGAALTALRARLARRPGAALRNALRVATALIEERASGGRGGLALIPEAPLAPEQGRISLPRPEAGRLSDADDEPKDDAGG